MYIKLFDLVFRVIRPATFIIFGEIQIQHLIFPMNYIQLTLVYAHVTCLWQKLNQRLSFLGLSIYASATYLCYNRYRFM